MSRPFAVRILRAGLVACSGLLLTATGCASPQAPEPPSVVPRPALGITPEPLPSTAATTGASGTSSPAAQGTTAPPGTVTPADGVGGDATSAPATTSGGAPAAEEDREPRTLVTVDDPAGDVGADGPAYADIRQVRLDDLGDTALVTVTVAGDVPQRLEDGQVAGVGIDLWRSPEAEESAYQLFADGGSDGWRAYLQTPEGFVRYSGDFRMGGTTMVFEVPWVSLGGLESGAISAFLDWSEDRPIANAASQDLAPDEGAAPFRR